MNNLIAGLLSILFGVGFGFRAVWGLRHPEKDLARNLANARRMLYSQKQLARITPGQVRAMEWAFVAFASFFTIAGIVISIVWLVGFIATA